MTLALGVNAKGHIAGNNVTVTTNAVTTQTSGSGFVLLFISKGGAPSGVSDSKGNTWTQLGSTVNYSFSSLWASVWYCLNGAGGSSHTFTGTQPGFADASIFAQEITTSGLGLAIDNSGSIVTDSASPFTNTITTVAAATAIVALLAGESASNPATHAVSGGSFAIKADVNDGSASNFTTGCIAAEVVSSVQTGLTASFTESGNTTEGIVGIVSFSEAGTGAAPMTPEDPWQFEDSIEDFEWLTLNEPIGASVVGSSAFPVDDPWQVESDIEDFDWQTLDPGTVVASVAVSPRQAVSDEWDFFDPEIEVQFIPNSYMQSDSIVPIQEDAWPHDDFAEDQWESFADEYVGIRYAIPPVAQIYNESGLEFINDDEFEDFFADHFSNSDSELNASDEWLEESVDDEWWPDDALIGASNAQQPYSVQDDIAFDESIEDDWIVDDVVGSNGPLPTTLEDPWSHDDYAEDEWWVDENIGGNAIIAQPYEDTLFDADDYIDDEWYVLDTFINENQPQPADDAWPHDDSVEDDWPDDTNIGPDATPASQYVDDAWPHDDYAEDEWYDDNTLSTGFQSYVSEDAWQPDDFAEDDWWTDDTSIGSSAIQLVSVIEDGWTWDDDTSDDWDVGLDEIQQPTVFVPLSAYIEDAWSHDDFAEDDWWTDEVIAPSVFQGLTPEDAWPHDDWIDDEWFVEDNIVSAPVIADDAWSWDEDVNDDWLVDDNIGDSVLVYSQQFDDFALFDEGVDDEFIDDTPITTPPAPLVTVLEDAWAHDDDVGDDWEWWLDAPVTALPLPSVIEDPTDWYEDCEDDWQWWLDAQLGASIPPSPIQHFGDDASYLEEWLQIDDDCDWYNINNLIIDAAKSVICILQAQDKVKILQDQSGDSIRIIGGN